MQRYDEAIAQLTKALATEPDFSSAHMGLWGAYYKKGMNDEALAEAIKFFVVLHDHEVADALTRGYAEGGYARAMHLGAEVLATRSKRTHVPAVRIARLYAHAGDKDEVLDLPRLSGIDIEREQGTIGVVSRRARYSSAGTRSSSTATSTNCTRTRASWPRPATAATRRP